MLTKWAKYAQSDNNSSYSRPITVNVYFKSENPPPGYYDTVDRPKTQAFQSGHQHLFTSKCNREIIQKGDEVPDMGAYDTEFYPEYVQPSAVFAGPTEKKKVKIDLYDPHKVLPKDVGPGPGEYFGINKNKGKDKNSIATSQFFSVEGSEPKRAKTTNFKRRVILKKSKFSLSRIPGTIGYKARMQSKAFSNVFQVTNKDRFGENIENRKPLEVKPPPGAYDAEIIPKRRVPTYSMGKISTITKRRSKFKAPGPAYYKPLAEPKTTSYHLNVQNTWM